MLCHRIVVIGINVLGTRSDKDISIDRWRQVNAKSALLRIRNGIGGNRKHRSDLLIENEVLAPARIDRVLVNSEHRGDLCRAETGAVYNPATPKTSFRRRHGVNPVFVRLNRCDLMGKEEGNAIFCCVFCKSNRVLEWIEDRR